MNAEDTPEQDILQQYAAIRTGVATDSPVALLHIGPRQTAIAIGTATDAPRVVWLEIGLATVPSTLFLGDLPTPLELENAIAGVEDEIMAAARRLSTVSALFTTDPEVRRVATIAQPGRSAEAALELDDIERLFDRFSAVVLGRPAGSEGLPNSRSFATTLLILRELMHHLRIRTLHVR